MTARRKTSQAQFFSPWRNCALVRALRCGRSPITSRWMCNPKLSLLLWRICIKCMCSRADVLRWMTIRIPFATDPWLNLVEFSVRPAFSAVTNSYIFCVRRSHQYRLRTFLAVLRIVEKLTLRPLTYLYRPNFPLRVVNGLPQRVEFFVRLVNFRLATNTTSVFRCFRQQSHLHCDQCSQQIGKVVFLEMNKEANASCQSTSVRQRFCSWSSHLDHSNIEGAWIPLYFPSLAVMVNMTSDGSKLFERD